MSIGLLFWVLAILAVIFGFWTSQPSAPAGLKSWGWVLTFVLILLLGWAVFGPALHR
jgi:cytochrome b561